MIVGLDHIVLLCPSIDEGIAVYETLLGREADWRSQDQGGGASAYFQLDNMALELVAPAGGGPLTRRLHALLERDGPGLQSIVFASDKLEDDHRLFERRALKPDEIQPGESIDIGKSRDRRWARFRLDEETTAGVKVFVLQRDRADPLIAAPAPGAAAMTGLDHVVINTANPDRSVAIYGGRLGLRMALDRSNAEWDARLIFFRFGGVTVELVHKLSGGITPRPDRLYGLTWRTADIEAAHARLSKAGLAVSEIRPGRRPATRVFTVKDGTMNVPTLILGEDSSSSGP
jgi:catechol 2,3-dioxygenase-like lactoylglutathione lyase family enzyme